MLFIPSPVEHPGSSYLSAVVNDTAVNAGMRYLFESLLSVPLGIYLAVELLDPVLTLHLTFRGTAKQVSTAVGPFYVPTRNA